VYDRELDGRRLSFGVSGKLYRNSLIMYDRETHSLWSHFLGAAVKGPLKGKELRFVPSTFTDWAAWRRDHPHTLVLDTGEGDADPYDSYYANSDTGILGTHRRDTRLASKDVVLAVLQPAAKAYAFRDLARFGTIRDTLAGKQVEIRYDDGTKTARAFLVTKQSSRALPATPVFWFAWVDFFPSAPLWEPKR
jgi:Protein of unknown function (DUF3179)